MLINKKCSIGFKGNSSQATRCGLMDKISPERRSENMRRIRSKNTKPEMTVRSLIHRAGYRYRLHRKGLPGKPDIVFGPRHKVIFVHGCFWHQHSCRDGRIPDSNRPYWQPKLERTVERDKEHRLKLKKMGWKSLIIWECQLKSESTVMRRIKKFLDTR